MRLMTAGEAPPVPVALAHQSSPDKRGFFENHPPSPSLPLKKGLHLSPKSSLLRREDLKPGRPGRYSQASSRPQGVARDCLRNRKLTLLTLGCARQSIQASLMLCSRWHESCECFTQRVAIVCRTMCECLTQ